MNYDLYQIASRADDAWSKALVAKFGKRAGDARYSYHGTSTPELKELYEAKVQADTAWLTHVEEVRANNKARLGELDPPYMNRQG